MSLISHPENDSRQLYTSVGTYKGNLVAIRKVNKKNVELTRNIKKELKVVGRWICHYRPPEGGRLYDMKVVSGYAFLRTYYV